MIDVVMGSVPGKSFSITHDGVLEMLESKDGLRIARITAWTSAVVLSRSSPKCRAFRIARDDFKSNDLVFGPFAVRGNFYIAETINNPMRARVAFKNATSEFKHDR